MKADLSREDGYKIDNDKLILTKGKGSYAVDVDKLVRTISRQTGKGDYDTVIKCPENSRTLTWMRFMKRYTVNRRILRWTRR